MAKLQHILCVDASHFKYRTNGFATYNLTNNDIIIAQREQLETNDQYRQVLPINIFLTSDKSMIWAYQRTEHGQEDRLHGKIAVAVGGHWDLNDVVANNSIIDVDASLSKAIERELSEEVTINGTILESNTCNRVICADETDVDRKHVAILRINVVSEKTTIIPNEPDLLSLGFIDITTLTNNFKNETWTNKIIEILKDQS